MVYGPGDNSTNIGLNDSTRNRNARALVEDPLGRASRLDGSNISATHLSQRVVARPRWEIRYAQAVAVADLVAMAVSLGMHKWWGDTPGYDHLRVAFGLVMLVLTVTALVLGRAWDPSVLGQGSEELSRLLRAVATLAVVVGLAGLALKLPQVRPYVFGVV